MILKTSFTVTREMLGPTTNGWSAMTEAEVGDMLAMASRDDLPRELAVLAVNEMAGNAGAVKGGTNDGTITEEVETGLPADGWETFAVGVEIMGMPPIAPGVQDIMSKVEVLGPLSHLSSLHRLGDQGHDPRGQRNTRRRASLSRSDGFANIGRFLHWSGHRSRRLVKQ